MLSDAQDAFGHEIHDCWQGEGGHEIVERDDCFFSVSTGPALYFLEYDRWPRSEQEAIAYARGRVLDIGCGAGRHALYLQGQGMEVVGIDPSPLAVKVCKVRGGLQAHVLSIAQVSRRRLGMFDTIVTLGNNFCLVGNPERARWLLRRFLTMTTAEGRILAGTRDPYRTEVPEHLAYHARNRERGRPGGQARVRVRYKRYATPWIDFLMLSVQELKALLVGTGWAIIHVADDGGAYVAVLGKEGAKG